MAVSYGERAKRRLSRWAQWQALRTLGVSVAAIAVGAGVARQGVYAGLAAYARLERWHRRTGGTK